jgi:hypothetical protein
MRLSTSPQRNTDAIMMSSSMIGTNTRAVSDSTAAAWGAVTFLAVRLAIVSAMRASKPELA